MSVRPFVHRWVRMYVRTSVRPQKCFFDSNEIWRVGRGRLVMHDGMQYDLIPGQGHEPFKVSISGRFQKLSPVPFTMEAGS